MYEYTRGNKLSNYYREYRVLNSFDGETGSVLKLQGGGEGRLYAMTAEWKISTGGTRKHSKPQKI